MSKQKEPVNPRHKKGLTADNRYEQPDPRPLAVPVGFHRPPSLADTVGRLVRSQLLAQEAARQGFETPEEADDFEVGDDYEPLSPYENDHIPSVKVMKKHVEQINKKIREAQNAKAVADFQKANPGGRLPGTHAKSRYSTTRRKGGIDRDPRSRPLTPTGGRRGPQSDPWKASCLPYRGAAMLPLYAVRHRPQAVTTTR